MEGVIQTVLGPVPPNHLGYTLTHEHLSMEFLLFHQERPEKVASHHFHQITHLNQVGYVRQYPYSCKDNLVLNDARSREAVLRDVAAYKSYGGGTIVENSTVGLKRDINFIKSLSQKTKVHVVVGTGYYIQDSQVPGVLALTEEDLYNHMLDEIRVGSKDDENVKAGFIGEVASVWPITDFEKRVIRAAAAAQRESGCGVSFHPHRDSKAPFEVMRLYLEAGGRADKAVMSHLDRTLQTEEQLAEFSKLGAYCQWDLFGTEVSAYQLNPQLDMPSDAQRLDAIKTLVKEGRSDRILMSHDVHTKHRLTEFGGHGYHHILVNVLPKMRVKGFDEETIKAITIDNPAKWLTIK